MIDIHTHLLPGIDDGPSEVDRPVKVLTKFAADGITDVVLTPHARSSDFVLESEEVLGQREAAMLVLQAVAPEVPTLHLGFEVLMNQPLPPEFVSDRRISLAGSRYILVEFYKSVAERSVRATLESIVDGGMVPIIAHVERYDACNANNVSAWRAVGAKVQVDAREFLKDTARGRNTRDLTSKGLVDLTASDTHGDPRSMTHARKFFTEANLIEGYEVLCENNPRAVIEDRPLVEPRPIEIKEGFWSKVKGALGI